jgi:hypothetical protein
VHHRHPPHQLLLQVRPHLLNLHLTIRAGRHAKMSGSWPKPDHQFAVCHALQCCLNSATWRENFQTLNSICLY